MKRPRAAIVPAMALLVLSGAASAQVDPGIAARIEAIPIRTLTISDGQFLTGDSNGRPTTIAGVLRVPPGTGRLPLVIFLNTSGGFGTNIDGWDSHFLSMGISTLALDSFSGRGLVSLVEDQSQLGRLNAILDLYRALEVLAGHPRVDPTRIAVMGFSRGGQSSLYAAVTRFQDLWNHSGVEPAAYLSLYPNCGVTFIDDTVVEPAPIRIFTGTADDYNPIGPCRAYVDRLLGAGADAALTELPGAHHVFDAVGLGTDAPVLLPTAQTWLTCELREEPRGVVVNTATGRPFTWADECIGRGAHVGYDAAATERTRSEVSDLLSRVFDLRRDP